MRGSNRSPPTLSGRVASAHRVSASPGTPPPDSGRPECRRRPLKPRLTLQNRESQSLSRFRAPFRSASLGLRLRSDPPSERPDRPAGGGAEALDQRLGAVEHDSAPSHPAARNNSPRLPSCPRACSASLSSLVRECHCRCKATSCFQVISTSSGAAPGCAPHTDPRGDRLPDALRHLGKPAPAELGHHGLGVRRSSPCAKMSISGSSPWRPRCGATRRRELLEMIVRSQG